MAGILEWSDQEKKYIYIYINYGLWESKQHARKDGNKNMEILRKNQIKMLIKSEIKKTFDEVISRLGMAEEESLSGRIWQQKLPKLKIKEEKKG